MPDEEEVSRKEDLQRPRAQQERDSNTRGSEHRSTVEPGVIGVALAVAAVAAVRAAEGNNLVLRAFSAAAFVLAVGGAAQLYWLYMLQNLPPSILPADAHGGAGLRLLPELAKRWARMMLRSSRPSYGIPEEEQLALGLLNILAAFLLVVAVVAAWILMSLR